MDLENLTTNCGFFNIRDNTRVRFDCCEDTKTTSKITVFIPVDWTNAFGFSQEHVKEWIDLLKRAFAFDIFLFDDIVQYNKLKVKQVISYGYAKEVNGYYEKKPRKASPHSTIENDEFYKLELNASGENTWIENYCAFVLIRYIYSHHYHPIVNKAFDIVYNLKICKNKELSAILIAHLFGLYDPFYGLLANINKHNYRMVKPYFSSTREDITLNGAFKKIKIGERNPKTVQDLVKLNNIEQLEIYLNETEK